MFCSSSLFETPQVIGENTDAISNKLAIFESDSFKNVDMKLASAHLGLFVGKHSTWSTKGICWRLYAPRATNMQREPQALANPFGHGSIALLGREISATEALERLQQGKPIRVQRLRLVAVLPKMRTLEALAMNRVPLASKAILQSVKFDDNPPVNYVKGSEFRFGLPTTLSSFAELKLFSSIYNKDVPIPPPLPGDTPAMLREKTIAENISAIKTRSIESGMHFHANESSVFRRFVSAFGQKMVFFTPMLLVGVVGLTSSTYVMDSIGWGTIPLVPTDNAAEVAGLPEVGSDMADPVLAAAEETAEKAEAALFKFMRACGSVEVAIMAAAAISVVRSAQQVLSGPSGFQICSYTAFKKLARGEPIVLQERIIKSFDIPFSVSYSWFKNYRPADLCSSAEELAIIAGIYLNDFQNVVQDGQSGGTPGEENKQE